MQLHESGDGLMIQVHWKGLEHGKATLESLKCVFEDAHSLVKKLLTRKTHPKGLVRKAKTLLKLL